MVGKMNTKQIKKAVIALVAYFLSANILANLSSVLVEVFKIENLFLINLLLVLSSLGGVLAVLIVSKVDFKREFEQFRKDFKGNMKIVCNTWFIGIFLMIIANYIINILIMGEIAPNEAANREIFDLYPLYSIISVCIFAPFAEEILFRFNFKGMCKKKKVIIILSGVLFGFMHVLTTNISLVNCIYAIPYSILGIAFAKMYFDTDTIVSSIVGHAMHNALTLIIIFLGV